MDFGQMAQAYMAQNAVPTVTAPPSASAGDAALDMLVGVGEMGGAGVLCAYLNARSPAEGKTYHEMFGYPTDVVAGVGGVGLGLILALFGSKAYGHVLRVGLGCLIEAGIRMAFEKGVADRDQEKAKQVGSGQKQTTGFRLVEGGGGKAPTSGGEKTTGQPVFQTVG